MEIVSLDLSGPCSVPGSLMSTKETYIYTMSQSFLSSLSLSCSLTHTQMLTHTHTPTLPSADEMAREVISSPDHFTHHSLQSCMSDRWGMEPLPTRTLCLCARMCVCVHACVCERVLLIKNPISVYWESGITHEFLLMPHAAVSLLCYISVQRVSAQEGIIWESAFGLVQVQYKVVCMGQRIPQAWGKSNESW